MVNKNVIEKGEMTKASYLKWTIDEIEEITLIDNEIRIINSQPV